MSAESLAARVARLLSTEVMLNFPHLSRVEAKEKFWHVTVSGSDGVRSVITRKEHLAAFEQSQKLYLDCHTGNAVDAGIGEMEALRKAMPYARDLSMIASALFLQRP